MNKSRLIWGIICLALAALLAVQTFHEAQPKTVQGEE